MQDEFIAHFGWIAGTLDQPLENFFAKDSKEFSILSELKNGWGKRDTIGLLSELTANYGDAAGAAVEKFLALHIARDWKILGEKEAHPGTEIDDFIRVLWKPLKESGDFDFTIEKAAGRTVFCVTRCPIHELARKTGLPQWLYHLACATDFYTTPAFSPKIGFSRTKTLIQNDEPCNHTYEYR
ncbi:MAG: L-2-amino-thiazoline-4-carboxylic acid hydrolase [Anaerolineales bacterium]|nr:L-2-amino-thiazoline-4-carboxylic acid hydrolase [Anaerolineales bacterium]